MRASRSRSWMWTMRLCLASGLATRCAHHTTPKATGSSSCRFDVPGRCFLRVISRVGPRDRGVPKQRVCAELLARWRRVVENAADLERGCRADLTTGMMQETGTTSMVILRYTGSVSRDERLCMRSTCKVFILEWHDMGCRRMCRRVNRRGGCKFKVEDQGEARFGGRRPGPASAWDSLSRLVLAVFLPRHLYLWANAPICISLLHLPRETLALY